MELNQFDYHLPPELIAQFPAERRDESRLLVVKRADGGIHESRFRSLPDYLSPGDVIVLNNTRVFPARLFGKKVPGGAAIEMLLLERIDRENWRIIAYRASRLKAGTRVAFSVSFYADVIQSLGDGEFIVQFSWQGNWETALAAHGHIPLPPYIARQDGEFSDLDKERYQTVYAQANERLDSAAAPTAGLHFTAELLAALQEKGIQIHKATLRVGLDTFLPMRCERVEDHRMHSEAYFLPQETADAVANALAQNRRVVAVGTTAVRILESAAAAPGKLTAGAGNADIFLYPGRPFHIVNAMITNFHLPRTTLLLLVSAFLGNDLRRKAYEFAIANRFRFYSYGDAMVIL
ncbi:MAG: tRNA preQ1(34) S-adenosylmethionine ribosyltransferase-isomerase QueA [Candidatus Omnitrophota bacterium]